ncbi:MAG: hypothetical protein ACTTJC_01525 [Campylobacter sp.]
MLNKARKEIVCLDIYNNLFYKFVNNKFIKVDLPKKNDFLVSYIQYQDLIVGQIQIDTDTKDDDLPSQISLKAYEELNLDTKTQYKIVYKESFCASENRLFSIFVTNSKKIDQIFSKVGDQISYIDSVIAAPLLLKALYNQHIINKNSTDTFVVLQKNDAFVAFYKDGEYVHSRPLQYSINNIYDKFILSSQANINEINFKEILKSQGEYETIFLKIFDDLIYFLNDVVNSFRRIYKTNIKNVFIISDIYIKNLDLILQNGLNTKAIFLQLSQNNIWQEILNMAAKNCFENRNSCLNLTPFERPQSIFKRQSGKLFLSAAIAVILTLIFPILNFTKAVFLQTQNEILDTKINELTDKINSQISDIKKLSNEKNELNNELEREQNLTIAKRNLLFTIDEKRTNYALKAANLVEISTFLKARNIKLLSLQNIDRNFTLQLKSQNAGDITELIQNINYNEKFLVDTKEIAQNSDGGFESNITVQIR